MEKSETAGVIQELMAQNLNIAADSLDKANSRTSVEVSKSVNGFERFEKHWKLFLNEYSKAVTSWWLETVDTSCKDPASAMKLWDKVFFPLMYEGFLVVKNERIQTLNRVLSQNNMSAEEQISLNDWADKVTVKHLIHIVVGTNQANEQKLHEKFNGPAVNNYRLSF